MKNILYRTAKRRQGFSLPELLAALTIGAMILVTMLRIYSRSGASAAAITDKLDSRRLPSEVLQRIAEDLDGIITVGVNTKVTVENKFEKGFSTARLTILKTIYDSANKQQTFEQIVWQTGFDYDSATPGLVLYRSHSGIASEDKLLDEQKEQWERELFVPVCAGVTFFNIQLMPGESLHRRGTSDSLPRSVTATISFAEPFKTVAGTLDVPDTGKVTRTIAIDKTRKIRFIFVKRQPETADEPEEQLEEAEEPPEEPEERRKEDRGQDPNSKENKE